MKNYKYTNFNKESSDEYDTTDFDTQNGWKWKQTDHLFEMGFEFEGDTRMKLCDKKDLDETLNVEIYKRRESNDYVMEINGRKHHFHDFDSMIKFIESKQID